MYAFLPDIQYLIPGCGLTWSTVWDCPYQWWDVYVRRLDAYIEGSKKKGPSRGH